MDKFPAKAHLDQPGVHGGASRHHVDPQHAAGAADQHRIADGICGRRQDKQLGVGREQAQPLHVAVLDLAYDRLACGQPEPAGQLGRLPGARKLEERQWVAVALRDDLVGDGSVDRAVDMIQADALTLHFNPLQEAVQDAGDTNFAGLAKKIEEVCKKLEVPVIAKEVGWGISERTAKLFADCGISAIDVAGAGGTSWSQVEMHRAPDEFTRELAATFVGWGIPTAESILNVKRAIPNMTVFASGGIKDGLDIAKCIALGATLGGMAGQFLKAAAVSTEQVVETMKLTKRQIEVTMFATGVGVLEGFQDGRLKIDHSS